MIAKRCFRALDEGDAGDPVLDAVFAQIRRDEERHVAFHVDTLRAAFTPLPRPVRWRIRASWRLAYRATGVSPKRFWRGCDRVFRETAAGAFGAVEAPRPAPART
jgi:hypothetical protein